MFVPFVRRAVALRWGLQLGCDKGKVARQRPLNVFIEFIGVENWDAHVQRKVGSDDDPVALTTDDGVQVRKIAESVNCNHYAELLGFRVQDELESPCG